MAAQLGGWVPRLFLQEWSLIFWPPPSRTWAQSLRRKLSGWRVWQPLQGAEQVSGPPGWVHTHKWGWKGMSTYLGTLCFGVASSAFLPSAFWNLSVSPDILRMVTVTLSQGPSLPFFFGYTLGMWKLPGQGSNLCHSSNPSYCSDSTGSLTHCSAGELLSITCIVTGFTSSHWPLLSIHCAPRALI